MVSKTKNLAYSMISQCLCWEFMKIKPTKITIVKTNQSNHIVDIKPLIFLYGFPFHRFIEYIRLRCLFMQQHFICLIEKNVDDDDNDSASQRCRFNHKYKYRFWVNCLIARRMGNMHDDYKKAHRILCIASYRRISTRANCLLLLILVRLFDECVIDYTPMLIEHNRYQLFQALLATE